MTDFRLMAIVSPTLAFHEFADAETAQRLDALGKTLAPELDATPAWQFFFSTSVATIASLTPGHVLSMFYHPWSDVALFCEWTGPSEEPRITGVELVGGDILRDHPKPQLIPLWRRETEVPPTLAVVVATSDTMQAFMNLYGQRTLLGPSRWQRRLPKLKTTEQKQANQALIGALFAQSMTAIHLFFSEASFARVRSVMNEIRQHLLDNQPLKVIEMATEITPESRRVLIDAHLDWQAVSVVAVATDVKSAFVFLGHPDKPEVIASFWFDMPLQDGASTFRRVDFLGHMLSPADVDQLAVEAGMNRATGGTGR